MREQRYEIIWHGGMKSPYGGFTKGELLPPYNTYRRCWPFEWSETTGGKSSEQTQRPILRTQSQR